MDVVEVLKQARAQAHLSQRDLARRSGIARSSIGAYERGDMSPTVRQLVGLLKACGLVLRPELRPLSADLDEQVAELLTGTPVVETTRLVRVAETFDANEVTWAVDGPTALALQGLALSGRLSYAVVLDDPFRVWIARHGLRALNGQGDLVCLQADDDADWLTACLSRGPAFGMMGVLDVVLRVVPAVEDVLTVQVEGRAVPVLRWHEVLLAHPERAEAVRAVMARRP